MNMAGGTVRNLKEVVDFNSQLQRESTVSFGDAGNSCVSNQPDVKPGVTWYSFIRRSKYQPLDLKSGRVGMLEDADWL